MLLFQAFRPDGTSVIGVGISDVDDSKMSEGPVWTQRLTVMTVNNEQVEIELLIIRGQSAADITARLEKAQPGSS